MDGRRRTDGIVSTCFVSTVFVRGEIKEIGIRHVSFRDEVNEDMCHVMSEATNKKQKRRMG